MSALPATRRLTRQYPLSAWSRNYLALALMLYLLGTSKWGSYLPFARPPYISDIVLGILVAQRLLFGPGKETRREKVGSPLGILIAAMVLWSAVELVRGPIAITALRDGAPYLYAVLALLIVVVPPWSQHRSQRVLTAVMMFHGAWLTFALALPTVVAKLPAMGPGGFTLLSQRQDIDGAICGLFVALALHRALSGRAIMFNVAMAGWNVVLLFWLKERAGLVAFAFQLAVLVWLLGQRRRAESAHRARPVLPLLLIFLPLLVLVGSQSVAYQRALGGLENYLPFIHVQQNADTGGAQDTTRARSMAWKDVIHWLGEDPSKEFVGVGFGPDYLHASGADVLLLGGTNSDIRSPHNYFVNTWARLGLVGLVIVSAVVLCGLWLMVLVKRSSVVLTDLDIVAFLIIVGVPAVAAVGVVLESPFGAIPYFWALGYLNTRLLQLRADKGRPSTTDGALLGSH